MKFKVGRYEFATLSGRCIAELILVYVLPSISFRYCSKASRILQSTKMLLIARSFIPPPPNSYSQDASVRRARVPYLVNLSRFSQKIESSVHSFPSQPINWLCSVMVITADSDSADPGSIPGTTFQALFFMEVQFLLLAPLLYQPRGSTLHMTERRHVATRRGSVNFLEFL